MIDKNLKALIGCLVFCLLGYAPPDDQAEAARLAVIEAANAEAMAMRESISADVLCATPFDNFVADGLTYSVGTLCIPAGVLDARYSDGYCTSHCYGIPTEDGQTNVFSAVGAPYIKMNGGAWLLKEDHWVFCKHDGRQLDIPDEWDLLPPSERGQHRLPWLTFLLEHTPDPPCARTDVGYMQPPA